MGKLLDEQYERIENAMAARQVEITALERRLAEICSLIASDGATVIDGTPASTRRNVN